MNQKRVRISSTLAAFTALAVAAVAVMVMSYGGFSTAQSTAATIDVLNVGMCVATDEDVFSEEDCNDGDNDATFTVAGRDELIERDTVYATYAHDPISSAEQPRGILTNSDLIKVTINDPGRDRRRTVIYPAVGFSNILGRAPVLAEIKSLLNDSVEDQSFTAFSDRGITVYNPRETVEAAGGNPRRLHATVSNSGNSTLLFQRDGSQDFVPLSEDEENDVVKWFGFLVPDGTTVDENFVNTQVANPSPNNPLRLRDLGATPATLIADEDRTEGGGRVAPWMAVNANIPAGQFVQIVAILYETSDQEIIDGDAVCAEDMSETGNPCFENVAQPDSMDPNFTEAEITNKTALVAEVVGDNGYEARNLYLEETDRFSGRYSGYIRLTDANGNGRADSATGDRDWGLELKHGTDSNIAGATVVGVLSEATIRYRDSDGTTRTFSIEVDIQPPSVTVNAPLDGAAGDDRSPDFVGTFEDGGAGLAEDTFRLYVDNITDAGDGDVGDSRPNSQFVIEIAAGVTLDPNVSEATLRRDYAAPASDDSFGVIPGKPMDPNGPYFDSRDEADLSYNDTERKIVEADSYDDGDGNGTFDDDARFDGSPSNGREIEVDFQAIVLDLAGNIGFSDADPSGPAFIDDLGEASGDRVIPNVLGWYSAHVIDIDDKDPEVDEDLVVTGYYDVDGDGDPVPHRRGIMITFDNNIDPDIITTNTFTVELDDGTDATVRDVLVDKNRIFLRLDLDMASNETPEIAIGAGHRVEDFAGNQLQARELEPVEANDGIGPNLVVSLGGGTGTGTGDDGPDRLTSNTIVVSISSDEALQGSPFVAVVCSNIEYREGTDERDLDDYVDARMGGLSSRPIQPTAAEVPGCGGLSTGASGAVDRVVPQENQSFSRPGLNWEHTWRNAGGNRMVPDGEATVVVFARDRSSYALDADGGQVQNWGAATTTFTIDSVINEPEVLPEPGDTVAENRPWISLNYEGDASTVTIEEFRVDGVDVTSMVDSTQRNRFIYSPTGLDFGDHDIEVTASDSAGNEDTFDWTFEVTSRSAFVVRLVAGWNAISIPYRPVDGSIEAVFTNASIKQVIGYDLRTPDSPWKMALRQDNVWTTNFGELTVIEPGFGYWVHSDTFVNQEIRLEGRTRLDSTQPTLPIDFPRCQGWNLVGVVDQDADQTQSNDWNQTLKSGTSPQNAEQYLGNYTHAYVWDGTTNQLRALDKRDPVLIGAGIWAFYDSGTRSGLCPPETGA